jgi:hypothetical protein
VTNTDSKIGLFIGTNFWTLFGAGFVLIGDLLSATYGCSILVCPIWFLVSVIRNRIVRTGWRISVFRAATPALILGIVVTNALIQWKIADANGERLVRACESFHSENGKYPKTLSELVPRYLPSIPPAKYSLDGEFYYVNSDGLAPMLWWDKFGPLHKVYFFDTKEWRTFD